MKAKHLLSIPLLLISASAASQTIDESTAMQKAASFFHKSSKAKAPAQNATPQVSLAYTASSGDETYFYVFNSNSSDGGFVIVGGDEAAQEILGYSNTSTFDYDTAPDNMKWWLSQYSQQIHEAIADVNSGKVVVAEKTENTKARGMRKAAERTSIPDLITTKWGQDDPFNSSIPKIAEAYNPFVTGCVATAMAQVMKFHNYPTRGTGEKSYHISYNETSTSVTFSANFGSTTYDWKNMTDEYSDQYDYTRYLAVSKLMYHCGVSVQMKYGTSASSASVADVPAALIDYFDYDKSGYHAVRNYYTNSEWEDLIYNELRNNRPVLYGAQDANSENGHAFVCHGYDASNGKYAINWGWEGYCDGYFSLSAADALMPHGSGTGGAGNDAQYTVSQEALINIMPNQGGTMIIRAAANDGYRFYNGNDQISTIEIDRANGTEANLTVAYKPMNISTGTASFYYGVMLKETTTGRESIYNQGLVQNLQSGYFYSSDVSCSFSTSIAPYNGTYEVYPAFSATGAEGTWQIMRYPVLGQTIPTITITGGEDDQPIDVAFSISGNEVMVGRTLSITHSPTYKGEITYTSSDENVATVDENGIITAVGEGTATITAEAAGNNQFNPTKETFKVKVVALLKEVVYYSLSSKSLYAGEKATISCLTKDYSGTATYYSSDENVATVDQNGIVTAVGEGTATIRIKPTETDFYLGVSTVYDITVKAEPDPAEGMMIVHYPIAGMNGYISPSNLIIPVTVKNNSSTAINNACLHAKYQIGNYIFTYSTGYESIPANYTGVLTIDLASAFNALANANISINSGTPITVYFYRYQDQSTKNLSDPYNVQSVTFTYVDDIDIDYTLSAAEWGTICLPFDAEIPTDLTAYTITGINGNKFVMEKAESFEMNKAYLVNGTPGTYTFSGPDTPKANGYKNGLLYGNTMPSEDDNLTYAPQGSYVLQKNAQGLGFYQVEDEDSQKIRQYSAYLQFDKEALAKFFNIDTEQTAIDGIAESAAGSDAPAYNLNGVRVNRNAKGFVIINGKLIYNK